MYKFSRMERTRLIHMFSLTLTSTPSRVGLEVIVLYIHCATFIRHRNVPRLPVLDPSRAAIPSADRSVQIPIMPTIVQIYYILPA